ncbi:hypothetical protein DFJ43DRAFT_1167160 [Lentinula guzmanii]|uniref:RING-type domain-containing protein n=3 Tax=Lentinula TaxID=5352 RepID=A0AA38MQK2_9AGAR|nr:hypothetical protein DFJ43DRAFT_1167160 [Lentinula guzmanii]KAJ3738575.1 hypothetical protein DFH05DRAFT_1597844 [Lentinula detonsa]KAJ3780406.1 hypothetical protein GGU10DRAFT_416601 [Lentinula aff. detonsa]KAJ3792463.1 hypothetical protein GGU11DRAFT_859618 [Lentinula aff. detonsa]
MVGRKIIVISDSDDDDVLFAPRPPSLKTKDSTVQKTKFRNLHPSTMAGRKIIVISDSDDDDVLFAPRPPSLKRKNSSELPLERDLTKLKKESDEHKKKETLLRSELVGFQNELALLRSPLTNAASSKAHVPMSKIEVSVACEVCMIKMWTPYILECGHTYCQSCLQNWFSQTLVQHMTAHPNHNPNQPPHGAEMHLAYGQYYHYMPQPQYTCPTCRKQVRNPPVENFNLKKVVRAVASVQGEASPKKAETGSSQKQGKAKSKALAEREDPWSGFFRKGN